MANDQNSARNLRLFVNGFDRIRHWLLNVRFTSVIVIGFAVCLLFPICAQPLGEAGGLIEPPFAGAWLTTCALVLAYAHRSFARSSNTLIQFGGPISVGVLYAGLTIGAGGAAGFWLAAHIWPTVFR